MEKDIYLSHGVKNREEYLIGLSEEYGISVEEVMIIADMFGPSEDFDGLISNLEDYASFF